jgi:hypothetical protein
MPSIRNRKPKINRVVHQMSAATTQIRPDAIFNHADTFFHALDQLHRSPFPAIHNMAMPVMVVSAFASELYFKTLIGLEGKKLPRSHDLQDLFSELSPKMQRYLENRWDPITRDREELYKNIDRQEGTPIPRALRDAIAEGREGFERLRYVYEGGSAFRFVLSDLPLALRRTVLDLQPSWAKQDKLFLGRTPTDPIPDHLKEGTITVWMRHPDVDWSINITSLEPSMPTSIRLSHIRPRIAASASQCRAHWEKHSH